MSDIPTTIQFNAQVRMLPQQDSEEYANLMDHNNDNITNQDLSALKAMVKQMKSNPSLIVSKCTCGEVQKILRRHSAVDSVKDLTPTIQQRRRLSYQMSSDKRNDLPFCRSPAP